jgi:type I restriction enzyme, S subunit
MMLSTKTKAKASKHPLPDDWRWVKFSEIIAESQPGFASGKRDSNGVVQLRMNNVDTRGNLLWNEFLRVPAETSTIEKYRLEIGDIVFNNTNSTELVGKSALFVGFDEPVVYSNHFTRFRVRPDLADSGFVTFWLISQWQSKTFEKICNRWIGQSAVKNDKLFELEIPLPPLDEQKLIAKRLKEELAAVDVARKAAEEQLEAAFQLESVYLKSLFGSESAQAWNKKAIGSVAKVQTGYAFKSEWFSSNGIRLLRNANVFQGYINWDDTVRLPYERRVDFNPFELNEGDIVLSLDRPVVNNGLKVSQITLEDIPALLLQRVARFQVSKEIYPVYLYLFLRSSFFIDQITRHDQSIGVPHISPKQVEAIILPVPDLNTQKEMADTFQGTIVQVHKICETLQSQLEEINALPSALLRRAFEGGMSSRGRNNVATP